MRRPAVLDTRFSGSRSHAQARCFVVAPLRVDRREVLRICAERVHVARTAPSRTAGTSAAGMCEKNRGSDCRLVAEHVLAGLASTRSGGCASRCRVRRHRLRHERRVHLVRNAASRAVRLNMNTCRGAIASRGSVDFHLCGAVLVDQRVDLDLLRLAERIDVVEQRVNSLTAAMLYDCRRPPRPERPIGALSGSRRRCWARPGKTRARCTSLPACCAYSQAPPEQ